jgi:transmembrane sensor
MTIDNEAARWTARIDRGLSTEDQSTLDAWLQADDRHKGALLRAQAAWSVFDRARALDSQNYASDPQQSAVFSRRRLLHVGGTIAAVIVAAVSLHRPETGGTYLADVGEIKRVQLEDGSVTLVNTQSSVNVQFDKQNRYVQLSRGEAWFQVAKNKERPFTVSAGALRVQAVGTAFDVRRHGEMSEIVVTEGVVRIWSVRSPEAPIELSANSQAVVTEKMGVQRVALTPGQTANRLAWRQGRIVLDEITLGEAASEFNRYNNVKLWIAPELAHRRMVGSFHTDDLDGFASACAILTNARVERTTAQIIIRE